MPDTSLSTLDQIRTKVRLITRSPSAAQLTNTNIDNYINTFVLYDFPEQLRLTALMTNFTFYTNPYIDVYPANSTDPANQFYNFHNKYVTVHNPIYVAGFPVYYSQSYEQFFALYPKINSLKDIVKGNGATTNYVGNLTGATLTSLTYPILKGEVTFSSSDANNAAITLIDYPYNATIGYMEPPGTTINYAIPPIPTRQVNYVTGAYNITFPIPPGNGKQISSSSVPIVISRPQGLLFWDQKFIVRPVPDRVYKIDMNVYQRPTELIANNAMPEFSEWFQYIAYGASKKIFEDRMDMDSIDMIMREFKLQERLILRRTLNQNATQRASTIYTGMSGTGYGGFGTGGTGWGPW